jgi:hypothetical protein
MSVGEIAPKIQGVENQNLVNTFSTNQVLKTPNGGTGDSSLGAYEVLVGGTTSTDSVKSVSSTGSSGTILTSNGSGALPTWQSNSAFFIADGSETSSGSGTSLSHNLTSGTYTKWEGYIFGTAGSSSSGNYGNFNITFNSDTSGHYSYTFIEEDQTGDGNITSSGASSVPLSYTGPGSGTGNSTRLFWKFSIVVTGSHTLFTAIGGYTTNSFGQGKILASAIYTGTATSIQINTNLAFVNMHMTFAGAV